MAFSQFAKDLILMVRILRVCGFISYHTHLFHSKHIMSCFDVFNKFGQLIDTEIELFY